MRWAWPSGRERGVFEPGGTYAFGVAPAMMAVDIDVGIGLPQITGPLGRTFGPFNFETGETNLAPGDTGIIPVLLGWHAGNFHWNFATFALAPTGDYSKKQLANTGLNHWAIMPRVAATYFNPKTGSQLNGSAIYVFNFENKATDSRRDPPSRRQHHQESRPRGRRVTAYAMIQTTPDTGAGARLGAFESRVNGIGPLVTYTLGDPKDPLTVIAKYYKEFDAENTFEGESFDIAVTAKF
ncbi:MAG: transporter [Methyloceanibacter sp.]